MTMRDQIAALLWRTEAVDSGTPQSVIDRRTPEAFADQSPELRGKWFKYADAILAALPGMIPDLVWENGPSHIYFVYGNLYKDLCGYNFTTEDIVVDEGFSLYFGEIQIAAELFCTPEDAKAAANAHNRAAIAKAAGWTAPAPAASDKAAGK